MAPFQRASLILVCLGVLHCLIQIGSEITLWLSCSKSSCELLETFPDMNLLRWEPRMRILYEERFGTLTDCGIKHCAFQRAGSSITHDDCDE
jgi:hypothetical protein